MTVLMIAIGGALGSVARFLTVSAASRVLGSGFPYGTVLVNVVGSFLMGVAVVVLMERLGTPSRWSPLVMTGFLGGFTTFSAFSLDAIGLLENGRMIAMVGYAGMSVAVSLMALVAGLALARAVML